MVPGNALIPVGLQLAIWSRCIITWVPISVWGVVNAAYGDVQAESTVPGVFPQSFSYMYVPAATLTVNRKGANCDAARILATFI